MATQKLPVELRSRLASLGISDDHLRACKLPLQEEAINIIRSENDVFGRVQHMTPATLHYWKKMKRAASRDGIGLAIVSAYRSIDYQCRLIAGKLEKGQCINTILNVNAIPGFSEHHTGRAIDLTCQGHEPLNESFESTDAFRWLTHHARQFHFTMSYPRDNPAGIIYEPWHWICQEEAPL